MVHTLLYTELLQCSADAFWEAYEHLDDVLSALMADRSTNSVFLQGYGGPGSIRVVKMGPGMTALIGGLAITHDRDVKERMDKFDGATKTIGYTVLESYPQYSSFSAEMTLVPVHETSCKVVWTAKYEPVGDAGPPEYIKERAVLVFKTLERAALSSKTLSHTEVLDALPDAIWEACKHVINEWLLKKISKVMSELFASSSGEPGTIRVVKSGPAIPHAGEEKERLEIVDEANKALGYTVQEGDPRYLHFSDFSAVTKLGPGAAAYPRDKPRAQLAIQSSMIRQILQVALLFAFRYVAILVFKALEGAANAN